MFVQLLLISNLIVGGVVCWNKRHEISDFWEEVDDQNKIDAAKIKKREADLRASAAATAAAAAAAATAAAAERKSQREARKAIRAHASIARLQARLQASVP
ncbi:hypothetical protein WJX72_010738 [[Myrmecia] bisecta]|uniref:Uncharacterized protein n=1 Tax=[Myrmecia] bisecta TaxID=41462 RepID=A0AAW1PYJ7_9CHLO